MELQFSRQKWVHHQFNLGIDVGWSQNIITRISDIGMRCQYHCEELSDIMLSTSHDQEWSIKEHIGHLIDLEELHLQRIDQFKDLKTELTAADMSNQKTKASNHNDKPLKDLIAELIIEREKLIHQYLSLSLESINHSSHHPRLNVKMKPVDLLFFIGEHDDHHLTSILEIKKKFIKTSF
ncbi:MAG: DinB family protein [Bacteroidetes bacterium]|nr:DinB family protein [Bacteroidota bacterium]